MLHSWIPGLKRRKEMLEAIGAKSWLDLYSDVPRELLLPEPPRVGAGSPQPEWVVEARVAGLLESNRAYTDPPPMIGGGLCYHHVPAAVLEVVSRGEFYTAYTPYQPEINQGVLQALFEYQSLMADLTELDVVNASMYDGSTAAAEALLMAMRVTGRREVVVAGNVHPERIEVIRTWLLGKARRVKVASYREDTRLVDLASVSELLDSNTAAIYVESPNFFGALEEELEAIADAAHKVGALLVVGFEPLSLGLVKPPGRVGADVAVAEGQPLGLGLNYGGPLLGVFAVRGERRLVRQLPGRLVGLAETVDGERAFTLILQAREQHIRREKATSNITTNEALMAIAAAAYLALLGGEGLRELAKSIWRRSHYAAKLLEEAGLEAPAFEAEFFKEFTFRSPVDAEELVARLRREGVAVGPPLSRFGLSRRECLACITEAHSAQHIRRLAEAAARAVRG